MSHFDVLIVGGGIARASLGAEVAAEGRTLIIEAESQCGYHSTGRSAAFYLESYGGPDVSKLTLASGPFLEHPPVDFSEEGFLSRRGALHLSDGDLPDLPPAIAVREVGRAELERMIPGIRPKWVRALLEPGCADIDVARLHAAFLAQFRRRGGTLMTDRRFQRATRRSGRWHVELGSGDVVTTSLLVNAAGAWADSAAEAAGVPPLGILPKRRTMVQLRVGRTGIRHLPLVDDAAGTFYFKGETDSSVWLSPHDEIASDPCDAAPDEIDVAIAIDRFEGVVDWPVERVERSWAGLRSFSPDRVPVYGFDPVEPGFFWCVGQGGFGIQTSPAAAKLAAAVLLSKSPDAMVARIDPDIFSPARFAAER
ncbi:MAG TPA: FAD-dependent oxidoreductase [Sphingomicrobium sp.]|nr:FAD-dependent oxidoreductase [Sphingomicrobium sp.]